MTKLKKCAGCKYMMVYDLCNHPKNIKNGTSFQNNDNFDCKWWKVQND